MEHTALVIVESPTKARTIRRFLPKNYIVEASIGHVRDLPQSASDIPKDLKKTGWARLGIDVENGFKPLYIVPRGKGKIIRELKKKLKDVDQLLLATDEDREGESISWHLVKVLDPKVPVKRMVFHEITKTAIQKALENERDIDTNLVNAQETRRILDRLYGYTLSPLIWKKIAYGLSAGRVQSPGLRLIVERERERIKFKKSVYWDLKAQLKKQGAGGDAKGNGAEAGYSFEAALESVDGKRVAGKGF
ncbi:MAG: toprim domain-containing protein [Spirochaetia bacterium]|nr:toprim domain-containing protein [Spirochaetia bacterium]